MPDRDRTNDRVIDKIVAATDFSDTAGAGVVWAADIARLHRAHLTLVHAVQTPPPRPDYFSSDVDSGSALQEAARQRLEEAAEEVGEDGLEGLHTRLLVGRPHEVILDVADEVGADLVVLGTRGHSRLRNLLLGSTAQRVVQHCPCPVLTTHGGERAAPRPLRTILVPTDFDDNARRAASAARKLLAPQMGEGARLVLFHAYHLPVEYTAYGTVPVSPALLDESKLRAEADLADLAGELAAEGLVVEAVAAAGYPVEAILAAAEAHQADLITMGTEGRTGAAHFFLGSTAERVVQRAPCPVLTLRERGREEK